MADVLVVGAGPAGLSAAIALRRAGAEVTVIEQHPAPQPRVCGAFINPEGAWHLDVLGLEDRVRAAGAVGVEDSVVVWPGRPPVTVPIIRRGRAGIALPRPALERAMADALADARGRVRWGVRASGAQRRSRGWSVETIAGLQRETVEAPLLVIADGRHSTLSGRAASKTLAGWFGWNASFVGVGQEPGELSLHFHRGGYVGVLTFGDGVSNVCGLVKNEGPRPPRWADVLDAAVRELPDLGRLLRLAVRVDPFRGVGPLPFSAAMAARPGAIVGGDAAAVGDPYMGEGISRALGTGPAVLAALEHGTPALGSDLGLERYNRLWRSRYASRLRLGTAVRWMTARPSFSRTVLRRALSNPSLLDRIFDSGGGQDPRGRSG